MKRIAVIAHGLSDGGAERVASIITNALSAAGGGKHTVCSCRFRRQDI